MNSMSIKFIYNLKMKNLLKVCLKPKQTLTVLKIRLTCYMSLKTKNWSKLYTQKLTSSTFGYCSHNNQTKTKIQLVYKLKYYCISNKTKLTNSIIVTKNMYSRYTYEYSRHKHIGGNKKQKRSSKSSEQKNVILCYIIVPKYSPKIISSQSNQKQRWPNLNVNLQTDEN